MEYNSITNIENIESCYFNIPHLVYYSHIPAIIISLLLVFFVIYKNRTLLEKILFSIAIIFSLWVFFNLVIWTNVDSRIVMISWSLLGLLYGLIYILSLYFSYVFIDKKDISFNKKIILGLLLLPVILFTPTNFNLESFDTIHCNAIEGNYFANYYYIIGFLVFLWILILAINRYRKAEKDFKKQIVYLTIGIEAFLFSFFISGFITSYLVASGYLKHYDLEQYGLFGMTFFIGMLAYLIAKFKAFNIKLLGAQALVAALAILIGSQFAFIQNPTNKILTGITLAISIVFGWVLVRSVKKEVEQREEIQKLSVYKSELLSVVSHQIKNPLAIVKGYASLITDKTISDSKAVEETVEKIKAAASKLLKVLNNLLDFHHIEEGKMHYEFQKLELNGLLKDIVNDFQIVVRQKGLDLIFEQAPSEVYVNADIYKLSQVFQNLIDNSIKYTDRGWVKIKVEADNLVASGYTLITISDSGRGMSKDLIGKLFEKFQRGVEKREILGTGLGLYIAKEIIEDHQGEIWAESEGEGKGSRFYVRLKNLTS